MRSAWLGLVVMAALLAACGSDADDAASTPTSSAAEAGGAEGDGLYPDVVAAEASSDGDGSWTFTVTLSSPYDSPARYADAWRVLDEQGAVLGVRELAHDHADEQPFTRTLSGVEIPSDVEIVTVEGRDQRNGWGGATVTVSMTDP